MEKRRSPRLEVYVTVGLRRSARPRKAAVLIDIAQHGCRIELPEDLRDGETVWLSLPGLDSIESRVARSRDFVTGLEFVRPLHPAVLDTVLARLRGF